METVTERPNIVRDKSFGFALKIIELSKSLKKDNNYEIASLLKRKQSEELTQKYKQIVAANS